MLLMLHQLHTYNNTLYLIFGRGDKTWTCDLTVTFGDPVATSFKTSFEELAPLRNATSISHPSRTITDGVKGKEQPDGQIYFSTGAMRKTVDLSHYIAGP